MKIEIRTTQLGIEYRCDKPFLRGLARTLAQALKVIKRIKEPTACTTPTNDELSDGPSKT